MTVVAILFFRPLFVQFFARFASNWAMAGRRHQIDRDKAAVKSLFVNQIPNSKHFVLHRAISPALFPAKSAIYTFFYQNRDRLIEHFDT